jgi:hypothetical protein
MATTLRARLLPHDTPGEETQPLARGTFSLPPRWDVDPPQERLAAHGGADTLEA